MTGRALVIGGAGFIGLHLSRRLLDDGWSVVVTDNMSRGVRDPELARLEADPGFELVVADLADPAAIAGFGHDFTHVFHFAALLGVANVIERPSDTLRANVALLEVALDLAAGQTGLERFVFPSTSEVYAGSGAIGRLDYPTPESTPLTVSPLQEPRTSYMLSKIYGEALCQHAGLPATIVRPHNFYGPRMGQAHVVPQLSRRIHDAADGDELVVYSPDHQRTFCYIDDAVEHLVRLTVAPEAVGGTFNVGVQEPEVRIDELAQRLMAVIGRDLQVVPGPTTQGSPARRCPDLTATTAVTGHHPAVDLDEGLRRTYEWYRATVFEGDSPSAT